MLLEESLNNKTHITPRGVCFSVQRLFKILLRLSENKKTQKVQDICSYPVEIVNVKFIYHYFFKIWYFQEPWMYKDFTRMIVLHKI